MAQAEKSLYELQAYSSESLQKYFDQDALLLPVDTIKAKSDAKDFAYFLKLGNFLKVVDTLEKYESALVDRSTGEGREFILFKRQLYMMYEVQNRSVDEHQNFSFSIERDNLRWLYQANLDFCDEMTRVNRLEQMADHGDLKGSVFKAKMMGPNRLKGLGSFFVASQLMANMSVFTALVGHTVPIVGVAGSVMYGISKFSEQKTIKEIKIVKDGEHKGKLEISVAASPFVTKKIIARANDVRSVVALGDDNIGAADTDANLIEIDSFEDAEGVTHSQDTFILPADSFRDR